MSALPYLLSLLLLAPASGLPPSSSTTRRAVAAVRRSLAAHQYRVAQTRAEELISVAPGEAAGWFLLGLAQLGAGHADEASTAFEEAARLAPSSVVVRFNLATACFEAHHFAQAEAAYVEAARLDSKLAALALLNAGFSATQAGRPDDGERHLRAALERAAPRNRKLQQRADLLVEQVEEVRERQLQTGIRRHVREAHEALLSGRVELAERHIRAARELVAVSHSSELEEELADVASAVGGGNDDASDEPSRFGVSVGVGGGYDTNVPQSAIVVGVPSGGAQSNPGAPLLTADLDLTLRAVGNTRNALVLRYSFSQTAILSSELDLYSLQDHTVGATVRLAPAGWLGLDLDVEGYLVLNGLAQYGPFSTGVTAGPRIAAREGRGFELRAEYRHTYNRALDSSYPFLTGQRDDASLGQSWHNAHARVSLGYQFHREDVGDEIVPVADLFPASVAQSFGPDASYHVPWSYLGHGGSLSIAGDLPWSIHGSINLHYEHRFYDPRAFIQAAGSSAQQYARFRDDDRIVVDATITRPLGAGFGLELGYTFVKNLSNVDNTNPQTPYDFDNRNYSKHVMLLNFNYDY